MDKVILGTILSPLLVVLLVVPMLFLAWPVMLLLGALSTADGLSFLPPLGYWATFGVVALLRLVLPTSTSLETK